MADLSDNTNWFETDASNNKAPPNGWPEGMMPSTVNDTARADKAAIKRFWDRINPVRIISPSSGTWNFVTDNPAYPTSYVNGEIYCFQATDNSVGGDQFSVNALGFKPILKRIPAGFTPIIGGDIAGIMAPQLMYDSTLAGGSGAFILLNPYVPISGDGLGGIVGGNITGNVVISGLIQTNYNGSGSGGVSIYATAGGIRSDVAGDALYLPNGDVVCQGITAASNFLGGAGSGVAIHCPNGAVQSDHSGTAFYAPNGNVSCLNITLGTGGQGFKDGGGAWAANSDLRLKQDIRDYRTGLNAILGLRPVTYRYNGRGGTKDDGRKFVGLIADQVGGVMPEMVGSVSRLLDPDDAAPSEIKTLDTTALIFALVNCCQELAARVASLEADVRD
jgi:hypothetical protein